MSRFFIILLSIIRLACAQEQGLLSLQSAIDLAIKNNPDILAFKQELISAQGRTMQARSWMNPEFGVSWDAAPSNFDLSEADETAIGLSQNIEWPVKKSLRIVWALQDERVQQIRIEQLQRSVIAQVRRAYYRCVWREKSLATLSKAQSLMKQWQLMAQDRYQVYASSILDVLRGRIENAKITNERISIERELGEEQAHLNRLLGLSGQRIWQLTDSLRFIPFSVPSQLEITDIKEKSLQIKLVRLQVEQAQTAINLARQSSYPDFNLGFISQFLKGQPPYSANQFNGVNKNWFWGAQISLSLPLWSQGQVRGAKLEAQSQHERTRLALQLVEREMETNIRLACDRVQASQRQVLQVQNELLSDVDNQWQTALAMYRTQQMDALNLIDFWRALYETKAILDTALLNYCLARIDLDMAGDVILLQGDHNEKDTL